MGPYTKAIATLVAAILAALAAQVGEGSLDAIDGEGWVRIAVAVFGGTAAVWFAENVPGVAGGVIKAVLASATAFFSSLATAYENDGLVSQGELLTAGALAVGALTVVYQLRNVPPSGA